MWIPAVFVELCNKAIKALDDHDEHMYKCVLSRAYVELSTEQYSELLQFLDWYISKRG